MFIDLKYVPSHDESDAISSDAQSDQGPSASSTINASSAVVDEIVGVVPDLDGNVVEDSGVEESETLIKSERAMQLAFPDSNTADDDHVVNAALSQDDVEASFDLEAALHAFDDDELAEAGGLACPSGYAQESHTRLVADPVKMGRHHDGRPRPHDPFACYLCPDLVFSESSELFAHVKTAHVGVWTDSICPLCGKQLGEKAGVSQHFNLGEKWSWD